MKAYAYNLAHLARILRDARLAAGLSQGEVADAAGLSRQAVSRIETATDCPLVSSVAAIVAATGADPVAVLRQGSAS
jgi:transcriptional regulator with XRE-family HTH domain